MSVLLFLSLLFSYRPSSLIVSLFISVSLFIYLRLFLLSLSLHLSCLFFAALVQIRSVEIANLYNLQTCKIFRPVKIADISWALVQIADLYRNSFLSGSLLY